MLPARPEGIRLHVGAGQKILDGYENLDAYDNENRPDHFQTTVRKFVRAELLDLTYGPETVAEIRCHHMFEHISILDVDRTLRGWNRILKPGGLVWIEVPDFEGCARRILRCRGQGAAEIYYRHIFGSQFGPGEFHYNGFTGRRLMSLLEDYGFAVKVAYVHLGRRRQAKPHMFYPSNSRLPDLTVKAIKVDGPKQSILDAQWTHVAYRRHYPNAVLAGLQETPYEDAGDGG